MRVPRLSPQEHDPEAIDLFAGPGGWDVGARALGLDPFGVEYDHSACKTRRAAGLLTWEGDVRDFPMPYRIRGLIASPPCQSFSLAGKGAGRQALDTVLDEMDWLVEHGYIRYDEFNDERTGLVLEPLRYALKLLPEWIAWEQVPPVLPVWEEAAKVLQTEGYRVWTGVLNAADYGVPQTRKRAILIASSRRAVGRPAPTHAKDGASGLPPWVSMAQALGWGMTRPATALTNSCGRGLAGGSNSRRALHADKAEGRWVVQESNYSCAQRDEDGNRLLGERAIDEPSATITGRAHKWKAMGDVRQSNGSVRSVEEPSATLTSSMDNGNFRWTNGGTTAKDTVRVTVAEAGILQSFPWNHPWQGTKTKQYEQVGNAIPPGLALHVLAEATGLALPAVGAAHAELAPTGLVVSTGNNSYTVGPGYREGIPWREASKPYERSIDQPAPTVDCKAGGAWKIHEPGQRYGEDVA